jgi:multidrug efflux system membrane fusion protein
VPEPGGRPLPVTAEPARKADLNVRIVALGTVTPVSTVTVRSRVDGQLQKIFFKEGQEVEAGAPLVEVDPRPFEVQKQQTEAQLAKDNALLETPGWISIVSPRCSPRTRSPSSRSTPRRHWCASTRRP